MNLHCPPEVAPLEGSRLNARREHLERELTLRGVQTPRRRRGLRAGVVVAVGIAAVAAVLSGRGGGPDVVGRALAAVSRGPYLGVVVRSPHPGTYTLVHLETHAVERVRPQVEIWFDTRKHGARANAGGCIRLIGPATRSGCFGSVFGSGDPIAITGSLDSYRAALAVGKVVKTTRATVRGHKAIWLRVAASRSVYPKGSAVFVAVDEKHGAAVAHRDPAGQARRLLPAGHRHRRPSPEAAVLRPAAADDPAAAAGQGHGRGGRDVTLAQAARILPGALWARAHRCRSAIPPRPCHRARQRQDADRAALRRSLPRPLHPDQAGRRGRLVTRRPFLPAGCPTRPS